jgi:mannose-1-phosphate guanylyltransferase / mannose-6-phosphate isomerase
MSKITPVILSGGAGTRLWPLSTAAKPKQFHQLGGDTSLFAQTISRVRSGPDLTFTSPMIVCGTGHEATVLAELRDLGIDDAVLLLEPMARNTAPALAAAALMQCRADPEGLMLVLPADHVISRPQALRSACDHAMAAAQSGKLVTFAIIPDSPETGYGYIKRGTPLYGDVYAIDSFREKPDATTAQSYLNEGTYAWNAGIFFFKAQALIDELALYAPEILIETRKAVANAERNGNVVRLHADDFGQAPAKSIDYAVMEATTQGAVVPVDMGWNDLGSFATLWEISAKTDDGNVEQGLCAAFDTKDCLIRTSGLPVALIGVSDLVVIVTEAGVLVTHKDRAQDVRLAAHAFKAG